jgi:hypothetical protein
MTNQEIKELKREYERGYADGVAEGCDVVAKWMMRHEYATGHGDTIKDLLEELEWQIEEQWECAAAAEREACAKLVSDLGDAEDDGEFFRVLKDAAIAIRARGNK